MKEIFINQDIEKEIVEEGCCPICNKLLVNNQCIECGIKIEFKK